MIGAEILSIIQNIVSVALVASGLVFVLAGAVGVLRLPDFYTRLHAAGVTDTLGAELVLIGLAVQAGFTLLAAKILLVGLFLFLTSPTSTHAIADAAHKAGLEPILKRFHPQPPGGKDK
ncbi:MULTISPECIES: monovalent cation/H(+) antiporter subunit G [Euryhalocaulis]|uniref:monovalent cation/H(+) antiporter subunit G n=1 Tax=Euryhalocaulis TaxID=1712422 RepID=UPI0003A1DBBC|nr:MULTISPECIES: monovalent cation/H(+) antiporter subunit G [Euryhalocaulis]MBA4802471.1 monovalent cation/H(+) antiporter subunit G [Euryhalocaulis sp.]